MPCWLVSRFLLLVPAQCLGQEWATRRLCSRYRHEPVHPAHYFPYRHRHVDPGSRPGIRHHLHAQSRSRRKPRHQCAHHHPFEFGQPERCIPEKHRDRLRSSGSQPDQPDHRGRRRRSQPRRGLLGQRRGHGLRQARLASRARAPKTAPSKRAVSTSFRGPAATTRPAFITRTCEKAGMSSSR